MSFNGYGKMNSDDVGVHLHSKTDANNTIPSATLHTSWNGLHALNLLN